MTGEALKLELVRRWFALYPGIRLVNAYGATEVSDDTMHEVLSEVPVRDFVSVGRSLRNVHTYVLDRDLRLAPLGAPGEIAFSGVAVGRGYINDPERTAAAFVEDPYRPGTRMYRTGDFGRWLPEGRIEFLGRCYRTGQDPRLPDRDRRHREQTPAHAGGTRGRRGHRRRRGPRPEPGCLLQRGRHAARRGDQRVPRYPAARLHGPHLLPPARPAAAHRERQGQQEDAHPAGRQSSASPLPNSASTCGCWTG
ncbi:D-alanine--D-alanyl carrier protein ligase [Streptomyces badius]